MPAPKYIPAIYAAARAAGVDNELLHEMILSRFGVESIKQLTDKMATALLDHFNAGKPRKRTSYAHRVAKAQSGRRDRAGESTVLCGPGDLEILRAAAATRGWTAETLEAFCTRVIKTTSPRTLAERNKVLFAIQAMNRRDHGSRR